MKVCNPLCYYCRYIYADQCKFFMHEHLVVEHCPLHLHLTSSTAACGAGNLKHRTGTADVQRAHLIATINTGYQKANLYITPLIRNGWGKAEDGSAVPVRCLKWPALQAAVELVRCECKGQCSTTRWSCIKNLALIFANVTTVVAQEIANLHFLMRRTWTLCNVAKVT